MALIVLFSLCACAAKATLQPAAKATRLPEESTQASEPEPLWFVDNYVDDFGDETDDKYIRSQVIGGTFSNTAATDAELKVIIFYQPYFMDDEQYWLNDNGSFGGSIPSYNYVTFRLLEYGESPAVYLSSDNITLKFKVNGETYSAELNGDAPNGDVWFAPYETILSATDADKEARAFKDALYNGDEIKCIIQIDSSTYSFTVLGEGFKDVSNALYSERTDEMRSK